MAFARLWAITRCWCTIEEGQIDPSCIITHRVKLEDSLRTHKMSRDKQGGHINVVMKP